MQARHSAAATDAGYMMCPSRDQAVTMRRVAAAAIRDEAMNGLNALPRRGAEVGGLLAGSVEREGIAVESVIPVESEHRYGPSYLLSEADFAMLLETASVSQGDARVIGYYRSSTRPEFQPDANDAAAIRRVFGDFGALFLLVRPERSGACEAALFRYSDSGFELLGGPEPFPFVQRAANPVPNHEVEADAAVAEPDMRAAPVAVAPQADSTGGTAAPEAPSDPGSETPGCSAEQIAVPEGEVQQSLPIWVWVLLVASLAGLGALLGYLSAGPAHSTALVMRAMA